MKRDSDPYARSRQRCSTRLPPPTVYFPLLVEEALLVEPTETETKETLDAFAQRSPRS